METLTLPQGTISSRSGGGTKLREFSNLPAFGHRGKGSTEVASDAN
jgi:hypothetical protein